MSINKNQKSTKPASVSLKKAPRKTLPNTAINTILGFVYFFLTIVIYWEISQLAPHQGMSSSAASFFSFWLIQQLGILLIIIFIASIISAIKSSKGAQRFLALYALLIEFLLLLFLPALYYFQFIPAIIITILLFIPPILTFIYLYRTQNQSNKL